MSTLREILNMPIDERMSAYKANGISQVTIDGNIFKDYSTFGFTWEKTYLESPTRGQDGSISNLNSYVTFSVPRLEINFSVMSIDDYRKLMQLNFSKNEFEVICYDPIYDKQFSGKMYFEPFELAKLYIIAHALESSDEEEVELLGTESFKVAMVGTLGIMNTVSVTYHSNLVPDTVVVDDGIARGDTIVMGSGVSFNTEDSLISSWNTKADGTGLSYFNGGEFQINMNLELYAIRG